MDTSPAVSLIQAYCQSHQRVLNLAEHMTDATFPGALSPSLTPLRFICGTLPAGPTICRPPFPA